MTRRLQRNLHRHTFVWLKSDAASSVTVAGGHEWHENVAEWIALGQPFVVRRMRAEEPAGSVPLGLVLPLPRARHRIGLSAPPHMIARYIPPPTVMEAARGASSGLQAALKGLQNTGDVPGVLRVYGSLAWQTLTGDHYMTASSDIDLLVTPASEKALWKTLELLTRWEKDTGLKADGEFVFPGHEAVAWREFISPLADRVLVKTDHDAYLAKTGAILKRWESAAIPTNA